MRSTLYNRAGNEVGAIDLPDSIFNLPWNASLLHQVVVSMRANARTPVAHTKDRSEIRGGGKKPWRQKGTGQARHGSIRSPLWRGGGVTFGPRNEKNYSKKINKKMRAKALFIALSQKLRDGEILFLDHMTFIEPKAKEARNSLTALSNISGFEKLALKKRNGALIAVSERDMNTLKSFNNFGNIEVVESRNLNPVNVLQYRYLIVENPEKALDGLLKRAD